MVEFNTPLSIWIQIASLFFVLSGTNADLLLIRLLLSIAYLFLLINALLGSPLWPDLSWPNHIALDSLIWAIVGLYVHGSCTVALFLDELPVKLTDDQEALWRFFYRTGGLSKKLFKTLLADKVELVEYQPGDCIVTETHFSIVYQGQVSLEVMDVGTQQLLSTRTATSAECFDCKDLPLLASDSYFSKHWVKAYSKTKTKVFRISLENMRTIANAPFAKGVFQTMMIDEMEKIIATFQHGGQRPLPDLVAELDPMFQPLSAWEEPKRFDAGSETALQNPLRHLLRYLVSFFSPPPPLGGHPTGIRHTLLPAPSRFANQPVDAGENKVVNEEKCEDTTGGGLNA
jgi:hypothetical protein